MVSGESIRPSAKNDHRGFPSVVERARSVCWSVSATRTLPPATTGAVTGVVSFAVHAVLTFREWLDDFASPRALEICRPVIESEIEEIRANFKAPFFDAFYEHYQRIEKGERDLYF